MKDYFKHIKSIPHFHLIRSVESNLISTYLDRQKSPFLDLGCGDGIFGNSLGINNVYGIDIDENALNRLKIGTTYVESKNATASAIPYNDMFFGTVLSNCAVEHMDNIETVLKQVLRVLKPDGDFILTVPTPSFIEMIKKDKVLIDAGLSSMETINEYNRTHHHVNILSLDAWTDLLNFAGFKVTKSCYYLPGEIGEFVTRMDVLYTIQSDDAKRLISMLERDYKGIACWSFRNRIRSYLINSTCCSSGTHLIILANKVN